MARLTRDTRDGLDVAGDGPIPGPDGDAAEARADLEGLDALALAAPVDARAVRVRLAAGSRAVDEPALRVAPAGPGVLAQRQVLVDDEPADVTLTAIGHDRFLLDDAGSRARVVLGPPRRAVGGATIREVLVDGFRFEVAVESDRIASLRERAGRGAAAAGHGGPLDVRAIIPGKVASVSVVPGDAVIAGQQLLVVEAMKMQNELRAPRDGTIVSVGIAPGVNIEVGDLLVVIS